MSEVDVHNILRMRSSMLPTALIVGTATTPQMKELCGILDVHTWQYGIFDKAKKYKEAVYSSMHVLLRNIDMLLCVLTDEPDITSAIDIGYILGIASTPAYNCPVLVYNSMHVSDWPFLLHTVDAKIERVEDISTLMAILETRRGIADFATRLRISLTILRSSR